MMTRYWLSSNNNTKTIREINWITSLWSQFKTPILQTITASILSPFCSRLSTISWSSQPTISFWQISSSKKPKWASKTTKKYLRKFTKPPLTSHSVSNHKIWKWLTLQGTTGTRNLLKSHFPRTFPAQSWNKRVLMRDFWCSNQTDFRFWTVNWTKRLRFHTKWDKGQWWSSRRKTRTQTTRSEPTFNLSKVRAKTQVFDKC